MNNFEEQDDLKIDFEIIVAVFIPQYNFKSLIIRVIITKNLAFPY